MRRGACFFLITQLWAGTTGCFQDFSPDPLKSDVSRRSGSRDAAADVGSEDGARTNAPDDFAPADGGADPEPQASSALAGADSAASPSADECSLAGHYAMIERFRTDALGAKQDGYNFFYVELVQTGDQLRFASSVLCAASAVGLPPLPATIDDLATRTAYLTKPFYADRRGTVTARASGCTVDFPSDAWVRGATPDYYRDVNVPLPSLDEQAHDGKPGWEDWEPDGHPGVTLNLSGAVSGQVFIAARVQTAYTGTVQRGVLPSMRLALTYEQTRSTLGYLGSPLLGSGDAALDPDPRYNYVSFIRLSEDDASAEAGARCQRILDANPIPST